LRPWPDLAVSIRTPGWIEVEEATAIGRLRVVLPEMAIR